ncbi:MAG: hypothetical protein HN576_14050 [Bacteriovoracaceae bacterium]|nr:hypothetical protein [Bacteriovoracaceae bacterium]
MKNLLLITLILISITNSWSQELGLNDSTSSEDLLSNPINDRLNNHLNERGIGVLAREGGWTGNGGGFGELSNNIWFIGKKEIPYCIRRSPNYPFSKEQIESIIDQSLDKWNHFFKKYDLLNQKLAGNYEVQKLNNIQFFDKKNRSLNFNFIKKEKCGAVEGNQLTFLFGLENEVIKNYKKFSMDHPFGLAVRETYNHKDFTHHGIVWIDQFTHDKKELKHIILHELGHIFGMKHNSVYVMDEKVAELLTKKRKFKSAYLGNIESDSWIYDLKKGSSVVLTSAKGRRMHPRRRTILRREEKHCEIDTYQLNSKLPRFVRKELNIPELGCHEIILKLDNDSRAYPTRRARRHRRKAKSFSFKINLDNGYSSNLVGTFNHSEGRRPEMKGPGVMTKVIYNDGNRIKSFIHKLTLEKAPSKFPLTGNFLLNRSFIPAKISSSKGIVIELNFPRSGRWWTLKTSNNNFE